MTKLTNIQEKIVAKLQYGDKTKIANALGMSRMAVLKVLRGDYRNDDVWREAAKVAAENNNVEKEIEQIAGSLS